MELVFGFILLILWPDDKPSPPLRGVALGVVLVCVMATGFAALQVWKYYPQYAARSAELVPTAWEANDPVGLDMRSGELIEHYPHDPVARLMHGTNLFDKHDYGAAEQEARAGLAEHEILATEFRPIVAERLNLLLTLALWDEGKHDEAKYGVMRFCASTTSDKFISNGRNLLRRKGLCY